jgi:hypothetical protein
VIDAEDVFAKEPLRRCVMMRRIRRDIVHVFTSRNLAS